MNGMEVHIASISDDVDWHWADSSACVRLPAKLAEPHAEGYKTKLDALMRNTVLAQQ